MTVNTNQRNSNEAMSLMCLISTQPTSHILIVFFFLTTSRQSSCNQSYLCGSLLFLQRVRALVRMIYR